MFNNLIGKNKELGRFLFCERYTLPPVKNAMYIAEGQELKKGAVVDVNGYLIGTAGLQPYAVLEFDCDTRDGGKEASVFLMGEFNYDKLSFADGLSKDDMDNIVYNARKLGIVIKPYSFSLGFVPQADDEPENFEKAKKYAKVGDAIYADSLGNVHVIEGKSVKASTIPEGWEFVGVVALREGTKATILHKNENASTYFVNCWLFKVTGLTFPLVSPVSMVMQQGPASGSTPVEVGTYTSSEGVTTLDDFVADLDNWLQDNPTATGALTDYGWHAAKMKDADGNDACFIIVDNMTAQSRFSPVKSSTSGATAPLYMWNYAGFVTDVTTIKRMDGVMTYSCVWNKERFKAYNNNVSNPTDSLTTLGIFGKDAFEATTIVKGYYGTYDNYLDHMVPDTDATTGAYALFKGLGKQTADRLNAVKYTPLNGIEKEVFSAEAYAAGQKAHSSASVEGLNEGDWYIPGIDEEYEIFSEMKTDGSDPVNATFVAAGTSARLLTVYRFSPIRYSELSTGNFTSAAFLSSSAFYTTPRTCCVAQYDVGE